MDLTPAMCPLRGRLRPLQQVLAERAEPVLETYITTITEITNERTEEQLVTDVFPKGAIRLELRLAEQLVGGRVMWKHRFFKAVAPDKLTLVARQRQFCVEKVSEDIV